MATKKASRRVTIGGVRVTEGHLRSAIDVLTGSAGIMVKQPLVKARHPLAACDYHAAADRQREMQGDPTMKTKLAFIHALEMALAGLGAE